MTNQNGNQPVLAFVRQIALPRPGKGPSEIENRIFELLKSLPNLKADISAEDCRKLAKSLNGVILMAQMNHETVPAQQRVGAKRTQAELSKLSRHASKLARAFSAAHLEANTLIGQELPKDVPLWQFKRALNKMLVTIYRADDAAGALTGKGEKPSDQYAAEVTRAAAKAFTRVTGHEATLTVKHVAAGSRGTTAKSGGPFLEFLAELFAILGITASREYHARRLRRNRTQKTV